MGKEKALENIVLGVERLFDKKFPPEYNTRPMKNLDAYTYFMEYKEVGYSLDFSRHYYVNIEVELNRMDETLQNRLENSKTSDEELKKTDYLRTQKIEFFDNKIKIDCKMIKYPMTDTDINEFCNDLWSLVIQKVMRSIY